MDLFMGAMREMGIGEVREDVPLAPMTTMKVGGVARYFFAARMVEDIVRALQVAESSHIPVAILGGGSNTLVADEGFPGLVVKNNIMTFEVVSLDDREGLIRIGAGMPSTLSARKVAELGLTGLEWLVTLPGVVGGAVFGNAGAYGSETKDNLESVEVVSRGSDCWSRHTLAKNDCRFGYRDSIFKHQDPKSVIVSVSFRLPCGDRTIIEGNMKELLARRAEEQPLGTMSAGCLFKNPTLNGERVSAGELIDQAGLKGTCVGKACVSEKHGNFCINTGGATAADIRALAEKIKKEVKATFGVELEEEVQSI